MPRRPDSTVSVLVLDDHDVIHRGFRDLLGSRSDLSLVGSAATAAEALALVPQVRPDVVVVDVHLPDGNGVQVCRRLRSEMPQLRCLMMTSGSPDDAEFAARLAGAAGFVTKHASAEEIIDAVLRAAGDGAALDRSRSAELLAYHPVEGTDGNAAPRHLIAAADLAQLGERQRQILQLVLQGCTDAEIAALLAVPETTVVSQITVLFTSLDLQRRLREASVEANRIP